MAYATYEEMQWAEHNDRFDESGELCAEAYQNVSKREESSGLEDESNMWETCIDSWDENENSYPLDVMFS
jgi:hypothetical protein